MKRFLKFAAIAVGLAALLGGRRHLWRVVLLHVAIRPGLRQLPRDGRLCERGACLAPPHDRLHGLPRGQPGHQAAPHARPSLRHRSGGHPSARCGCAGDDAELPERATSTNTPAWHAGPHSATYSQIFTDPAQNSKRMLMDDCFRCHGMHFNGSIRDLVQPHEHQGAMALDSLRLCRSAGDALPDLPPGPSRRRAGDQARLAHLRRGRGRSTIRWPSSTAAKACTLPPLRSPFRNCTMAPAR